MTDERSRQRARLARATKTLEDQARVLVDRIRAGELDPNTVEWAAQLGSPVARTLYPTVQPILLSDYRNENDLADVQRTIRHFLDEGQRRKLERFAKKLIDPNSYDGWDYGRGSTNRLNDLMFALWARSASVRNRDLWRFLTTKIGDLLLE